MTHANDSTPAPLFSISLRNAMLIGAGVGLALISAFLISAGEPNPEWGEYWRIKPLLVVPVAGAMGGAFFDYMRRLKFKNNGLRFMAILVGLLGFVVALWLGSVFGLNGTYWN